MKLCRSGHGFEPNDLAPGYNAEAPPPRGVERVREYAVEVWRIPNAESDPTECMLMSPTSPTWWQVWRIPKVKRNMQLISMLGFVFTFLSVAFQPHRGPLNECTPPLYVLSACVRPFHI